MRRALQPPPPPSTCAECALDAIVLGAALLCLAEPHDPRSTHPAARMALISACRRAGLLDTQPQPPLLMRFDIRLTEVAADPARMRRTMVATMDRLVGSGRAAEVLTAIAGIGTVSRPLSPAGLRWLDRMRAALALPAEPNAAASDRGRTYSGGFRVVTGDGRKRGGLFALRRDEDGEAGGGAAEGGAGAGAMVTPSGGIPPPGGGGAAGGTVVAARAGATVDADTLGAADAVVVHPAAFARTAPAPSVTHGVTRK